jgi:hypothetical protein
MAWIKIEHQTPDKPEVGAIAHKLRITPAEAFLALFRVWAWADESTADGTLPGIGPAWIDHIARVAGFGAAMKDAGWLFETPTGLEIPNFDDHNGESAKARAQSQKRMNKVREREKHDARTAPKRNASATNVARSAQQERNEMRNGSVTVAQPEQEQEQSKSRASKLGLAKTPLPPEAAAGLAARLAAAPDGIREPEAADDDEAGPEGESALGDLAGSAGLARPDDPADPVWTKRRLVLAKAAICNSPIAIGNRGKASHALDVIAKSGRDPLAILDGISTRAREAKNQGGYLLRSLMLEAGLVDS